MIHPVQIAGRSVGPGQPCFVIAEIGINHNGDVNLARKLVAAADLAGCDAVKFQRRTPEVCTPPAQRDVLRETPWGLITYLDYRHRVEFDDAAYREIHDHCRTTGILWFASCWDIPAIESIDAFDPPCYKIASACLTDDDLLREHRRRRKPLLVSTGMSTLEEIDHAVDLLGTDQLILMHTTSTYPAKPEELNLRAIQSLAERYAVPVGYSGHEVGLCTTLAAVTLGAHLVERHLTLDRAMWGSDQAASVEPHGMSRLVRDIRTIEAALGNGVKKVYDSEVPIRAKLRRAL